MARETFFKGLDRRLQELQAQGICKRTESVITQVLPTTDGNGPRYRLAGQGERDFLRMNSNSYLGLALHPEVIGAEEDAARTFGTGPGAVRFISGTYQGHVDLEQRLAGFHRRESAMLFSAAYAAVMGVLPPLISPETIVLSDTLNHNSIINAVRLAQPADKLVYRHLDMGHLEQQLKSCIGRCKRLVVVTDGVFSMRGDHAPLAELTATCRQHDEEFEDGIVTVVDDSHGVGAFGATGRGTEEVTGARADLLVATLGKALGVNGGYVVADRRVIDYLRESSPFYIYSNPITPAEAAAASRALELLDGPEGEKLLAHLRRLTYRFREGLVAIGYETLPGEHPIVPLLVRDTAHTAALVKALFEGGVLVTGLNYPVVPKGDEEIRFQINAGHTERDIDAVLKILGNLARQGLS